MNEESTKEKGWRRFSKLKIEQGSLKRRARKIENATLKHANRFLVRRWTNIQDVARSTVTWVLAVVLLIGLAFLQLNWFSKAYTTTKPSIGGVYAEGIVGRLETVNPLFATTAAEQSAVQLIFTSLLDYDIDNKLRPDAAASWKVSEDGKTYDVSLRDDIYWHDGKKMTVDDVIFTIKKMQDETTRAVQYGNWVGVKVEKVDDKNIRIILPSAYAPFAHSLTFGILPEHILRDVRSVDLRENDFGRSPVGSGPFKYDYLQLIDPESNRLVFHLKVNEGYYRGRPLLNRFQIHTYGDRAGLERAITTGEVSAVLGLGADQIDFVTQRPSLKAAENTVSNGVFAIFNNDSPLIADVKMRRALVHATDRTEVLRSVYNRGVALGGPLPDNFIGNASKQEKANIKVANEALESLGWKKNGEKRHNADGADLNLRIVAPRTGDYELIVDNLVKQWKKIGIQTTVELVDADVIVADYLRPRNYDVLVYELAVGADPDVYQYWHSSQIKPTGLNFANYSSGLADDALSSARARGDMKLRMAKYKTFYEQWVKDAPAIALYQPMLNYVSNTSSVSFRDDRTLIDSVSRLWRVERWAVNEQMVFTTK